MILAALPSTARIWIFQADKVLTEEEETDLLNQLKKFVSGWQAHGVDLVADAEILHSSIVVIGVDESKEPPSGCSIDKAFGLLKAFYQSTGVDFFNRLLLNLSYCNSAKILGQTEIQSLLNRDELSPNALVFNALASTLTELRDSTYLLLKDTWMASKLQFE
ncbi:MAG: hypothetical protein RLZZ252_596 [Bacteroidota bacterium]|jgi:hypothetical protein